MVLTVQDVRPDYIDTYYDRTVRNRLSVPRTRFQHGQVNPRFPGHRTSEHLEPCV